MTVQILTPKEYAALPAHCRELPSIEDENIPEGDSGDEDEDEEKG